MKTEIRKFVMVVSTLGLLVAGAQSHAVEVENDDTSGAAKNTRTFSDHHSIAKLYENKAKELLVKAEERRRLLQHYEDKSYLYGRSGQDFQSHAIALERKYRVAAEKATNLAAFHHKTASELATRDFAIFPHTPQQLSSR